MARVIALLLALTFGSHSVRADDVADRDAARDRAAHHVGLSAADLAYLGRLHLPWGTVHEFRTPNRADIAVEVLAPSFTVIQAPLRTPWGPGLEARLGAVVTRAEAEATAAAYVREVLKVPSNDLSLVDDTRGGPDPRLRCITYQRVDGGVVTPGYLRVLIDGDTGRVVGVADLVVPVQADVSRMISEGEAVATARQYVESLLAAPPSQLAARPPALGDIALVRARRSVWYTSDDDDQRLLWTVVLGDKAPGASRSPSVGVRVDAIANRALQWWAFSPSPRSPNAPFEHAWISAAGRPGITLSWSQCRESPSGQAVSRLVANDLLPLDSTPIWQDGELGHRRLESAYDRAGVAVRWCVRLIDDKRAELTLRLAGPPLLLGLSPDATEEDRGSAQRLCLRTLRPGVLDQVGEAGSTTRMRQRPLYYQHGDQSAVPSFGYSGAAVTTECWWRVEGEAVVAYVRCSEHAPR